MRTRGKAKEPASPVYVKPTFSRREREAMRDWRHAAYSGKRHRPKPGDFDPLWLRLGLRMHTIQERAGWAVSNPLYDASLRRTPAHDPSLPGTGWLRDVYLWYAHPDLVTLPRTRAAIEARRAAMCNAELLPQQQPITQRAVGLPAQMALALEA